MEFWGKDEAEHVVVSKLEIESNNENVFLGTEYPDFEEHGYYTSVPLGENMTIEKGFSFIGVILKKIIPSYLFNFFQVLFYGCYNEDSGEQVIVDPHTLTSIRYITIISVNIVLLLVALFFLIRRKMDNKTTYLDTINRGFKNMELYKKSKNMKKIKKKE